MRTASSFTLQYGNRRFNVGVKDLLGAPVDAIVNAANGGLSHGGGVAEQIARQAGESLLAESRRLVAERGRIPLTQSVITTAGNLPYRGVIHAVGPRMTETDVPGKSEATIANAMAVADRQGWHSIAFPALGTGIYGVPREICANAFARAVPAYWQRHPDSLLQEVWLCLFLKDFPVFERLMNPSGKPT